MAILTAITPQVKDKERCNIFLDNSFYAGLSLETVIKYKLKVGMEIDKETISTFQYDSEKAKALDKAMDYISRAMKTEKQIKIYLNGKGYGESVIAYVSEKLKEYNYLDDAEYARCYYNSYKKKKGKKLIEYELSGKGVSKENIEKGLYGEDFDQTTAIKTLAEKYMKNKDFSRENLSKLYRHLSSKGFSYDEITEVISYIV